MGPDLMLSKTFHRLTVIAYAGHSKNKSRLYQCRCRCGTVVVKRGSQIRGGQVQSCGCLRRETSARIARENATHGHCSGEISPTYKSWAAMRERCLNPNHSHYARYGGRGIAICDQWGDFDNFLMDMGERPNGKSLDRIDNNEDYSPDNCTWSTPKEQGRNRKDNRLLTFRGETRCLIEWSEITGIKKTTLKERLNRGWSIKDALTKKVERRP